MQLLFAGEGQIVAKSELFAPRRKVPAAQTASTAGSAVADSVMVLEIKSLIFRYVLSTKRKQTPRV